MDYQKVKDPSQPVKILLFVIFGLGVLFLGFMVLAALGDLKGTLEKGKLGFATSEPTFFTNTTSSVTCSNASSVLAIAGNSARENLLVVNNGSNGTYLCRTTAEGCGASSGILIAATSTAMALSYYEQKDGYAGPYSCSGVGTTTLMLWSN